MRVTEFETCPSCGSEHVVVVVDRRDGKNRECAACGESWKTVRLP